MKRSSPSRPEPSIAKQARKAVLGPFVSAHGLTAAGLAPLATHGGVGLSGFLPPAKAAELARICALAIRHGRYHRTGTTLQRTTGAGEAGHYFQLLDGAVRAAVAPPVKALGALLAKRYPDAGLVLNGDGNHTALVYGLGGKNYTHQDPATEASCLQLLIFLGGCFEGGRFFVEDAGRQLHLSPDRVRHEFAFSQPGDAVLFWAKPPKRGIAHPLVNPFHGMTTVLDGGDGVDTVRFGLAVGIAGGGADKTVATDRSASWKPSDPAAWESWAARTAEALEAELGPDWRLSPAAFQRAALRLAGRDDYAVDTYTRAKLRTPLGHERPVTDADRGAKVDVARVKELLVRFEDER